MQCTRTTPQTAIPALEDRYTKVIIKEIDETLSI
jgi:hypothetical protein